MQVHSSVIFTSQYGNVKIQVYVIPSRCQFTFPSYLSQQISALFDSVMFLQTDLQLFATFT